MQRDHGPQSALLQAAEHFTIAIQGLVVEAARLRFHATPLDAKAMSLQIMLLHQIKIALGIAPPVTGRAAFPPIPDGARLLFERPPLVISVESFYLVRG